MKITKVTKSHTNEKGEFCSPYFKFEGVTGSLELSKRPIEDYTEEEVNEMLLSIGKSFIDQLNKLAKEC